MLSLLLALIGLANAFRVLWLEAKRPSDDMWWDACLLKESCEYHNHVKRA